VSITGVGSVGSFLQSFASRAAAQQAQAAAAQGSNQDAELTSDTPNATNKAVQDFLSYAKESPAQRMVDAWLKAHGLTEQDLAKMPPDKQAAIRKEMADDIKKQMEDQVQKNGAKGNLANIVV
jgi:hypothetical protein